MLVTPILEHNIEASTELRSLYARCISAWGIRDQEDMTQEECGELIVAINHHRRYRVPPEKILEEIADVLFMCDEEMYIHGFTHDELKRALKEKIARTKERVAKHESIILRDQKGCL